MDLTPYLTSLKEDLTTAASAGDEQTQRTAGLIAGAIEPAARLALMQALSDLAAEVTSQLDDQVVDVRLDGKDVKVVVTSSAPAEPEAEDPPTAAADGGDISRMTLRMFEEIKSKAEQAAAQQGVSLNTFISQAVQGALSGQGKQRRGPGGPYGQNLRGWVWG